MIFQTIGIDLDNTIIRYDDVFGAAVEEDGIRRSPVPKSKADVKAMLLASDEGERAWMRLQGRVYGAYIHRATPFPGVHDFWRKCADVGIKIHIVSHKTEFGHFDPDKVNLRRVAIEWLKAAGLVGNEQRHSIAEDQVHFFSTREKKVQRIAELRCGAFIDDLPEVLMDPAFPKNVSRHLFAPNTPIEPPNLDLSIAVHSSWESLSSVLLP